jgi:ABC-type phosphate/phosphonate transport system substrate-binding protein
MRASLPMYDLPETHAATDAFWGALAEVLGLSVNLSRDAEWVAAWRDPTLLFSQTCGYPLTHEFAGTLAYVATPHYACDGCEGPFYRSILLARQALPLADFRGRVAAFNSHESMSGMLALKAAFAPLAEQGHFFSSARETGSHLASLAAVQQGTADLCAIDCVTVALARRYRPAALAGLVEVGRTPLAPGLPFVTRAADVAELRQALAAVFADPRLAATRATLLLSGFSVLEAEAYQAITRLEQHVTAHGGLQLIR